jgi:uncharacterized Ntn-hydrolase superfamily protein
MTFSIVARDAESGELGVAVASAFFGVGAVVPWCRPGIGAVASQAIGELAYGGRCLDALEAGARATEALDRARAFDPLFELRQVAVVGADGSVAVETGALCVDRAGHVVGDGFSTQANMVANDTVWPAMAEQFRAVRGPLARRLLAALAAGAGAGGDARGEFAAGLVVVAAETAAAPGHGVVVDVRVDHHPDPVAELGRLLDVTDAYAGFGAAVDVLRSGGDAASALAAVDAALELLPADGNLRLARANALGALGDVEGATTELRSLVTERPTWATVIRGFAEKGLLALPPGTTIDQLLTGGE